MSDDEPGPDPRLDRGSRRRRPRMVPFLMTGAIIGGLIGIVLSVTGPNSEVASAAQENIVLGLTGALVGALVAAVLYLIAERSSRRHW